MILHWGLPNKLTGYAATKSETGLMATEAYSLVPGNNEIAEDVWEAAKKHPLVASYIEEGHLREVSKPVAKGKKPEQGLGQFDEKEAIKIIKGTYDLRLLGEWKKTDERAKIEAAIDAQLEMIEEKTRKPKKDDDEDDED